MLLTGILSILQVILLPGLVIKNVLKLNTASTVQKWLYIFALSLYINYIFVTLLVLFKIYYAGTLWTIIIAESVYLLYIYGKKINALNSKIKLRERFFVLARIIKQADTFNKVLIYAASVTILIYLSVLIANTGTVFYFTDTVNNYEWNKWAIDFSHNIFPRLSSHFPQLLPANWSVCYVLTGYPDIHFFPKAIMPLFILGIIFMFANLAVQKNNNQYLTALIIYGLFAPVVFSMAFIADGNADLPVSFFSFLAFYSFAMPDGRMTDIMDDKRFLLQQYVSPFIHPGGRGYIFVFLIASAAAATKLAGLYTFVIASLMLPVSIIYSKKELKGKLFHTMLLLAVITGISLFWYLKSPDVMYSGLHQPGYIAQSNSEIVKNAVSLMYFNWGTPVIMFFIITLTGSLFHKRMRYISAILVVIPLFMWMFKYSSDFRNLSFVIPYLSLSAAAGLYKIAEFMVPRGMPPAYKIIKASENTLSGNRDEALPRYVVYLLPIISLAGVILFLLLIYDKSFSFVYPVYEFINKYYFRSHRIVYFVDITLLLHVEFYQRVLIAFSLVTAILPWFILIKFRRIFILLAAAAGIITLNFTLLNGNNVIKYQQSNYDRVDAHNYYELINTMLKGKNIRNRVITNFPAIAEIKTPGKVKFVYNSSKNILKNLPGNEIIFLKTDIMGKNFPVEADSIISSDKYNVFLKDSGYILFSTTKK